MEEIKAKCKYCKVRGAEENMHKDIHTGEFYHEKCRPLRTGEGESTRGVRSKKPGSRWLERGLIGRPRKAKVKEVGD